MVVMRVHQLNLRPNAISVLVNLEPLISEAQRSYCVRLTSFRIENFRNLRYAECDPVPDLMVICGGNGSGKSALLEALMTAKEHAGAYGSFSFDSRAVSANADNARISLRMRFSEEERSFVQKTFLQECPEYDEIVIEIAKGGSGRAVQRSKAVSRLLSHYGRALGSPGFFDYITAHRQTAKTELHTWDASFMSDNLAKNTLAASQQKFQYTKQYLAGLKMRDLQEIQASGSAGEVTIVDSLQDIRELFNRFFSPLKFVDVRIDMSPFQFIVDTPNGTIDIDDMSSGEKEIFNIFIRFHQLNPHGSIILFDEADAHLHPDLERRYLDELRRIAGDNQLLLTTHSPEMMIAAGSDALFAVLRQPPPGGGNQLTRVTEDSHLHDVLASLMGSRGLVSFNQRILFIEGEDASADRAIYEAMYPPARYNVSFVPAGNAGTVRKTAEQVNALLTSSVGFQEYYSIIDRDIDRHPGDPTAGKRLFRLPVYHVENVLVDEESIFAVTRGLLGSKSPFSSPADVRIELENLCLHDSHLRPYARAILDARLAAAAEAAYDSVFKRNGRDAPRPDLPNFESALLEARNVLEASVQNGSWRADCKGRDLLKAYCSKIGAKYEHFRNLLIERLTEPPPAIRTILDPILIGEKASGG
jgi:predicted ATPase